MQVIQPAQRTIAHIELLMVEVVEVRVLVERRRPWHLVPTVVVLCGQDGEHHPSSHGVQVSSEEEAAEEERPQVRGQHFYRMAVCRDEGNRCRVFVMLLVYVFVEPLVDVEHPVAVI